MRTVTAFTRERLPDSIAVFITTTYSDSTTARWALSDTENTRIDQSADPLSVVRDIERKRWWNGILPVQEGGK